MERYLSGGVLGLVCAANAIHETHVDRVRRQVDRYLLFDDAEDKKQNTKNCESCQDQSADFDHEGFLDPLEPIVIWLGFVAEIVLLCFEYRINANCTAPVRNSRHWLKNENCKNAQ